MSDADQLHGRAIIAIQDMRDEIERLRAEVAENDGVIAVWRRRCQDAERELAALYEKVIGDDE